MSLEFKIRKAELLDVESVKNIEIECGLSPWSLSDYRKEIERDDTLFFICEVNREVVGFILARLITTSFSQSCNPNAVSQSEKCFTHSDSNFKFSDFGLNQEPDREIEIYNIGVRESFRRIGIGKSLLLNLIGIAESIKAQKLWLEVRRSNSKAFEFYSSNGFKIIQKRKHFYSNPVEDGFLMCRSIRKDKKT